MSTQQGLTEIAVPAPRPAMAAATVRAMLRNPWMWLVAGGCLLAIVVSGADIASPLSRDEGAFLLIGRGIPHGWVPYRDVFDHKSPGIYYTLAALLALTQWLSPMHQIVVARLFVVAVNVATAVGLVELGRRLWRVEVGVCAALLWLLFLPNFNGNLIFTEPFAVLFTVWAFVFVSGRVGRREALFAGLMLGLGMLFKQTTLLAVPGVLLTMYAGLAAERAGGDSEERTRGAPPLVARLRAVEWRAAWRWERLREAVWVSAAMAVGAAAPWLVVLAYFALAGALPALLRQVIAANFSYPADTASTIQQQINLMLDSWPIFWLGPLIVIIGSVARRVVAGRPVVDALTLRRAGLVVAGVLALVPYTQHVFAHYLLQVLPFALLVLAAGIFAVLDMLRPRAEAEREGTAGHNALDVALRAWALPVLLSLLVFGAFGRAYVTSRIPGEQQKLETQLKMDALIQAYAQPGMRVLIAPADPDLYFLSGVTPTTSYIYLLPVNLNAQLTAQVSDQLALRQFDVVAWGDEGGSFYAIAHGDPLVIHEYGAIYSALHLGYHKVATGPGGTIGIYLRN